MIPKRHDEFTTPIDDVRSHDPERVDLPDGCEIYAAPVQGITSYISDIRGLHGLYRTYADDPDQALSALDAIESNPTVYAACHYLGLAAAGNRWSIVCEDKRLHRSAMLCESAIRRIPDFLRARTVLARALLRGLSLASVEWKPVVCRLAPDRIARRWILPTKITQVDKRRLRLYRVPNRRDEAYWGIYDPGIDRYVMIETRKGRADVPAGFAYEDFLWYFSDLSERSVGFGEGIGDQLLEIVNIIQRCIGYRARLAERWAEPTFIYAVDTSIGSLTETEMGEAFKSPRDRADAMMEKVDKWRSRFSLTHPAKDKLEIVEHGGPTAASLEEFLRWLCEQVRTAILLGGLLDTASQGPKMGNDGSAEARVDATEANIQYHRTRIEEACDIGLAQEFYRRNTPLLMAAGFPIPEPGETSLKFSEKRTQKPETLKARMDIAKDWKLPVTQAYLYDEIGIPAPMPGEILAQPPADPQQQPMGGGGFGGGGSTPFGRGWVPSIFGLDAYKAGATSKKIESAVEQQAVADGIIDALADDEVTVEEFTPAGALS